MAPKPPVPVLPKNTLPKKKKGPSTNWEKLAAELNLNVTTKKKTTQTKKIKTETVAKSQHEKNGEINEEDIWFDDVPRTDIEQALNVTIVSSSSSDAKVVKSKPMVPVRLNPNDTKIGKYVAIDCEFVGVGPEGTDNALARVSLVNFHGHTVFDQFVCPQEHVTDYRTAVSGIRPKDILKSNGAISFREAQTAVSEIINNRYLVGHAVENDLKALMLNHPKKLIRDTTQYKPYRAVAKGRTPGLKRLAKEILGMDIQGGEHSSVEDARTTMILYRKAKDDWEKIIVAQQLARERKSKLKAQKKSKKN